MGVRGKGHLKDTPRAACGELWTLVLSSIKQDQLGQMLGKSQGLGLSLFSLVVTIQPVSNSSSLY